MSSSSPLSLAQNPLLQPVCALAGWTFVMQTWLHVTRIQAIGKYNVSVDAAELDADLKKKTPMYYRAIGDNYNHLHEQPTVFYAVTLALAMAGDRHKNSVRAAWAYVGIRVVHSLFQVLVNKVMTRFQIFASSSVVVAGLTARLATLIF